MAVGTGLGSDRLATSAGLWKAAIAIAIGAYAAFLLGRAFWVI